MESNFEKVEAVLAKFPSSWQRNYYQNKKDLIIDYKQSDFKSRCADYNYKKNIITIYNGNIEAVCHELFHMAFRDKDKVNVEIEEDCFYGNGVSLINHEKKALHGLTEGFVAYLTRLALPTDQGHILEYFFTDLLIFIYGEEILEYPLCNNPLGIMEDSRFYNLKRISKSLDSLCDSIDEIEFIEYSKDTLEQLIKEEKVGRQIVTRIRKVMKCYSKSIADLFGAIIEEYLVYSSKYSLEKELFIHKLSSLFRDADYEVAFAFDNKENILKRKLESFISMV